MRTIIIAAIVVATGAAASAQQTPTPTERVQTRADVTQRIQTMFARVDANRDGYITAEEVQAVRGQQVATRTERRAALFDRLDANRDNMISREEWARVEAMRGQRRGEMGQRQQRVRMSMMRALDTDRDRRISLQEATGAALARFDRVDANRDGQVTREERQQMRAQRQAAPAATR